MALSALLVAAALIAVLVGADGRVVGVWADIENKDTIVGPYLRNATAIAHTAGLRLAVDAQVGWGFAANSEDPSRPVFEQVMDIVDELTIMDYFTSCSNNSLSRSADGLAGDCDPTHAMMLAAPFLNYAAFLAATKNRTVLLDIGVALGAGQIDAELQLELFLKRTKDALEQQVGGGQVHNFVRHIESLSSTICFATGINSNCLLQAVFQNGNYRTLAAIAPCPVGNPLCCNATDPVCRADGYRPTRAVWWYGMFGSNVRTTWKPANQSSIDEIIKWCLERHITELYVDQYCTNPEGGCGGAPPAVRGSWEAFVRATDAAAIDLYLYVGEDAGDGVPATVADIAKWCRSPTTQGSCGPRVVHTPKFISAKFKTRAEAAKGCAESQGKILCSKADLAGYSGCAVGWCSDFEGYWMAHSSPGCGHAGYNARTNMTAGAWCC